jgi:hypothetical protein
MDKLTTEQKEIIQVLQDHYVKQQHIRALNILKIITEKDSSRLFTILIPRIPYPLEEDPVVENIINTEETNS